MAQIDIGNFEQALPDLRRAIQLFPESEKKQIRRTMRTIIQLEEVMAGKGLFWFQAGTIDNSFAPPRYHTATLVADEYLFVLGGVTPIFGPWALVLPRRSGYSPLQNGNWDWQRMKATGPAPPLLMQHTATVIHWQGRMAILVLGG